MRGRPEAGSGVPGATLRAVAAEETTEGATEGAKDSVEASAWIGAVDGGVAASVTGGAVSTCVSPVASTDWLKAVEALSDLPHQLQTSAVALSIPQNLQIMNILPNHCRRRLLEPDSASGTKNRIRDNVIYYWSSHGRKPSPDHLRIKSIHPLSILYPSSLRTLFVLSSYSLRTLFVSSFILVAPYIPTSER